MTVHLVTFATDDYTNSADVCIASALANGVDVSERPQPWNPNPVSWPIFNEDWLFCTDLFEEHGALKFTTSRGFGYWSWKPYVIERAMRNCADGDTLIYADAGIELIGNVNHIISRMDQPIWLFGNNWEHAHWCKRDIVEAVWPLTDDVADAISRTLYIQQREVDDELLTWQRFGKQCQASVIFFRVTDYTRRFVSEWLDWCLFEGGRLIDDSPSRTPNHPEFREHRHDQAILTTMAYRDGLRLHWWPASYNDGAFIYEKIDQYKADDYPVLFNHHRRRNHEWSNAA